MTKPIVVRIITAKAAIIDAATIIRMRFLLFGCRMLIRLFFVKLIDYLIFFFLDKEIPFGFDGTVFPRRNPHGFSPSMLSNITFIIAVTGMEINMPGIPHKAPPINTTMRLIKAFIFTLDATIYGMIK